MTRINSGINPSELTNKHLLAEHREIKRIPNVIKKGKYSMKGQPKEFKLGTGHVKFFYDKQQYLFERYKQLFDECKKRGFNVTDYSNAWTGISVELMNNYNPTERDRQIVQKRIKERLSSM